MNYGIVGLGLMGASLASRLMELGHNAVYGFDINPLTIQIAKDRNYITEGSTNPEELLDRCQIIILALYPTQIQPWIEKYQSSIKTGSILMDISGVKSNIVTPCQKILKDGLELISIHPMCGRESRGIEQADPTIFDDANFIVVPTEKNTHSSILLAEQLGSYLGCSRVATLTPQEHDRMIGFLSQLTHVIAVSLMNTHDNSHLVEYTGDSFRDLTRIASINEDLWSELFILNKDILLDETNQFITAITHFRDALKTEDIEEMKRLFIQSTERCQLFNK